ncbi:MAG: hypothetical protein A2157_09415 [Deltaproteobacteria bacterium RBG_16_47_11]|nr:MAG: hypothetical protein A2157_09415 [Deltaproteobacteria bacterium RBG_16_47_11]
MVKPARFRLVVIDGIFFLTNNSPFYTGCSPRDEFLSGEAFNVFDKWNNLKCVEIEGNPISANIEKKEGSIEMA